MSFQQFPFNLPTAALTLIDVKTGQPTNFFWQYLLSLFNRTGAGNGIVPIVATGLTAQGTTQATALLLTKDWNQVTSAPPVSISGPFSGVVMPPMKPGNDITVWNVDSAAHHILNVYPFSGAQISNSGAINAPVQLNPGELAYFQCWSPTLVIMPYTNAGPL